MTDVAGRLKTLRVCTDSSVETLVANFLVDRVANYLFSAAPGWFWRPYYNTPLAPMLRAQSDAEVVRIYAMICGKSFCKSCRASGKKKQPTCGKDLCGKSLADGLQLRGLDDLKNHRDVLCHPLTFQLDRAEARAFVTAKRHRADVRPALVWDIHRSIVDAQAAAGVSATVLDIKIGPYRTAVLEGILRMCWLPGHDPIPDASLNELMSKFWAKDRPWFEKHPDGRSPRKTPEELKALFEKMKKAWKDSR
jgi:hypothetical protein